MSFFKPYDPANEGVEVKRQRAENISAKIDRENMAYREDGHGKGGSLIATLAIIFIICFVAYNANAGDEYIFVDTTSSGRAIFEKAPDYQKLQAHYQNVVSESMESLQNDSLDQEQVLYDVYNISLQSIYANRLPHPYTVTPFNMICSFTDDPVLQSKLIRLISHSRWLRNDQAVFVLEDSSQFRLSDGVWYYVASEAEIREIDYDEVICLVMGVDYLPPQPVEKTRAIVVEQPKERYLPGYATVTP